MLAALVWSLFSMLSPAYASEATQEPPPPARIEVEAPLLADAYVLRAERAHRLSRTGVIVLGAGALTSAAGLVLFVGAINGEYVEVGLAGLALLGTGGLAIMGGFAMYTIGGLVAANHLRFGGHAISNTAGWVAVGAAIGFLFGPTALLALPVGLIAGAIQSTANGAALRERRVTILPTFGRGAPGVALAMQF